MSKNPPGVVFRRSYQTLMGSAAWSRLHPDIRQRFGVDRCHQAVAYRGVMHEVYMSFAGWLLAQVCRLIGTPLALHTGKNVATEVKVYPDWRRDGMTWDRYYFFPGKKVNRVRSTKCIQADAGLIEVIGSGFGMYLAIYEDEGALCFKSTRFFFTLANKKIPLPHLLTPGNTLVRQAALEDGRFQFSLEVRHPILGLVYYQVGHFVEFGVRFAQGAYGETMDSLEDLKSQLLTFARERDWEQFQSPKNLTMAICGEAGELAECFQWLTEEQSRNLTSEQRARAATEIADVQLYLILLAARMELDVIAEANRKMQENAAKYPVEKSKGNAKKYTELAGTPEGSGT